MTMARAPLHLAVLVLLSGLFFFWGLGSTGLTDRDEGRNAEAGREMLESGDWISHTFNYEPRYAKPVLVYWLMSASYHFFGVSERAARLPSAIFGLALIMMTYWFLTRLRDPVTGLIGALMLLLNLQIISLSRMALTDSVLIFLTTLALYAFWLGFQAADRRPAWLWLLYIAMALGTLAKGPVGFLVPLLTIALYLTATKQWRPFWREGKPLAGTVVFALLALPWYVTMWRLHGNDYAAAAQANTVGRFLNPMEGHGFSFLFYVPVLLIGFFPWSGWLPFAWYQAYRSWRDNGVAGQRDTEAGVVQRSLDSRDIRLFHALLDAAAPLHRSAVPGCRHPDGFVLVAVRHGPEHERRVRGHPHRDAARLPAGRRLRDAAVGL
jgi:4-amino-4-deoxy-L-arabinose transferase-like glycosyltransferase